MYDILSTSKWQEQQKGGIWLPGRLEDSDITQGLGIPLDFLKLDFSLSEEGKELTDEQKLENLKTLYCLIEKITSRQIGQESGEVWASITSLPDQINRVFCDLITYFIEKGYVADSQRLVDLGIIHRCGDELVGPGLIYTPPNVKPIILRLTEEGVIHRGTMYTEGEPYLLETQRQWNYPNVGTMRDALRMKEENKRPIAMIYCSASKSDEEIEDQVLNLLDQGYDIAIGGRGNPGAENAMNQVYTAVETWNKNNPSDKRFTYVICMEHLMTTEGHDTMGDPDTSILVIAKTWVQRINYMIELSDLVASGKGGLGTIQEIIMSMIRNLENPEKAREIRIWNEEHFQKFFELLKAVGCDVDKLVKFPIAQKNPQV